MPRAHDVYLIPASGAHSQASCNTSVTAVFSPTQASNASDQQTAHAMLLSAVSNDVYVTFDGSTPSSANGLVFKAGVNPWFVPVGSNCTIKTLAVAGTATVNVVWLT